MKLKELAGKHTLTGRGRYIAKDPIHDYYPSFVAEWYPPELEVTEK